MFYFYLILFIPLLLFNTKGITQLVYINTKYNTLLVGTVLVIHFILRLCVLYPLNLYRVNFEYNLRLD
jgi:hypothetical protein